ncbi:hypothetical protein BW13_10545 [Bifidobacterium sp. UTCIF-37]|uniref:Ribbon-helix-helix protein CopG domain-containing protein n=1 Tax=Bifidobacterium callitrichos TaxID=762209 RepID=A0A2T3GBB9_9BIFI|nr:MULTISPECIES: hypothetical protein [Bifidobacterium]PST46785.1 hypothetical protein CPA40_03745 [Bifidobacterium callitrichos]TPF85515.1 hypothetical protein BW13_10545 [Bifidobacterium sp. UTCIF-37]TPF87564.1 hypothetical protein BW11_10825 [Bifidobacterium sp. UTCIF-38]
MNRKQYIAKDGTPITDDMVERWASEAEHGFTNSTLTREADPFPPSRVDMRAHTIRIPDELWRLVEAAASAKHVTPSEYTRQALGDSLAQSGLTREQKVAIYAQTHGLTQDEAVNALIDKALA